MAKISKVLADVLLLAVAVIWGVTFPIVKSALVNIEPLWYLAVRFAFAGVILVPFFIRDIKAAGRVTWVRGAFIGLSLFAAYGFQTVGLSMTTASKTAFITGLYLLIVPVMNAVLTRSFPGTDVSLGAVFAVTGLALLSLEGRFAPARGDMLVLLCAFFFACDIILVERLATSHSAGVLTIAQVFTVSVLSLAGSLAWERPSLAVSGATWGAIILTGVLATSAAILVQNSVQRYTSATHAAMIFALEPVFAALSSYVWLGERLSFRNGTGALLMFAGMLIVEFEPLTRRCAHRPHQSTVQPEDSSQ